MTTHLQAPGFPQETLCEAWCGAIEDGDVVITLDEANHPDGRHFDCVNCHRRLTGGVKHSTPIEPDPDAGSADAG